MSKRKELRERRQRQSQQQQYFIVGAIVVVAVAVVGYLIYQNSRPVGSIQTVQSTPLPNSDGSSVGSPDAKVVAMLFEDFQCPICSEFNRLIEPQIYEKYIKTGKIRLDYRHLIVIDGNLGGTESKDAANASECAAEQGWFWPYHDMLFANQTGERVGDFAPQRLKAFAGSLKLDQGKFDSCLDTAKYQNILTADQAAARQIGASGTPAFFIQGQPLVSGVPRDGFATFERVIEAALAAAGVK
ncbi:MAG: DsbA family protein [Chloroflexota bacterium]